MRKELGYLALGLTPLLLITLAQGPLLRYQTSFSNAKGQYLESLQESRRQLADLGHTLRGLPSLTADSSTLASAGRTLNGFIIPGKIDHIAIFDQDCNMVANSDQGMPLSNICPVNSARSVNTPHFQWRSTPHAKSYELIAPLMTAGDKSYFLLASNHINDQWLFHHPDFKQSMNQLDLLIGEPKEGKVIYREEAAVTGGELATLSSKHPLLRFFPNIAQTAPLDFKVITGLAVALLLVCVGLLIRELSRRRKAVQIAIHKLYAWADELMPEGGGSSSGPLGLKFANKGGINIQVLQDRMSRLVKSNLEASERTEHEKRLLQQQMVRLESRYLEAQAEQTFMSKARSMHQQMHACADAYIGKLQDSQSLGEDLSHLTSHEVVRPAQRIMELMHRWQSELNEVSTRKFVRSLSERVDEEGVSELDESLNFLMKTGSQLSNAAINITLLTQKLLAELHQNTAMAQHWFHMMGHDNSIAKTLLNLLQDAQSLIEMQDKSIRYDNVVEANTKIDQLKIPNSTLTSTLFHCQMALVENAIDSNVGQMGISNQLRVRDGKVILVCSLRADMVDELLLQKEFSPKAEQHLSLALQMLQGFAIRLTKLPALNGVHAIALMWDTEKELDDNDGMKMRYEPAPEQIAHLGL
ncbi:MAG: hypothetical protein H7318_10555 [Oligoflexus sp.]|nr:hypothetical protein [Oligoflexus sp.]